MNKPALPLHQFTGSQWLLFLRNRDQANLIARTLHRAYPYGCFLADPYLNHFANIDSSGNIVNLPPPYRKYKKADIANKPNPKVCQCHTYFDPESGLCWGERHDATGKQLHHPFCQFEEAALENFARYAVAGKNGKVSQDEVDAKTYARPDDWNKSRMQLREKMGLK